MQLAAPRLLVAAEEIDGAAECVLSHLALDTACFDIEKRYSGLMLRERELAQSAPPVLEESPCRRCASRWDRHFRKLRACRHRRRFGSRRAFQPRSLPIRPQPPSD